MDLPTYYRFAFSHRPWDALVFPALGNRAVSVTRSRGGKYRLQHLLALSSPGRVLACTDAGKPVLDAPVLLKAGASC